MLYSMYEKLCTEVGKLYNCTATHAESVEVTVPLPSRIAWQGKVEVLDLHGHATAKRCFVYPFKDEKRGIIETIACLQDSFVQNAKMAVEVSVASSAIKIMGPNK